MTIEDVFGPGEERRRQAIENANLAEHMEGRGLEESAEYIVTHAELRTENRDRAERDLPELSKREYFVSRYLGDEKDKNVLELGTSTGGVFVREVAPYVAHVDAISNGISETEIGTIEKECQNCDVRLADAASLPYEDNRFDFIFGIYIHQYFKEDAPYSEARAYFIQVLSEICRTLKPGGTAILSPSQGSRMFRYYDPSTQEAGTALDNMRFTPEELALLPAGVQIETVEDGHSQYTKFGTELLSSIRIKKPLDS